MNKTYLLIFCVLLLCACRKKPDIKPVPPKPPAQDGGTLTLEISQPGTIISPNFEGLSFENWILSRNPEFLDGNNQVFVTLLKNLGPGIIRMGGNSSDETDWTGDGFNTGSHFDILTPANIDKLADLSTKTNWQVIFGLNLGHNNISASVDEAQYLYSKLGANLLALQIGNEPDYYRLGYRPVNYSVLDYEKEWIANFTPIKAQIPTAQFGGPDVSDNLEWASIFATDYGANISFVDAHYYNDGPATNPAIDCETILSTDYTLVPYLQSLNFDSQKSGLPYRITEANSIWGGGKPGVSDTFSATLWALDLMWTIAANNGQGINFHGGELVYSPISVNSSGQCTANPVYYAMLAFKYGATGGTNIPVDISNNANSLNYTAFASYKSGGGYSMTIINKEEKKDVTVKVNVGKNVNTIDIMRLTAPAFDAKTGITFAGSSVQSDGSFSPGTPESHQVGSNSFTVTIPAASAAVVTIN